MVLAARGALFDELIESPNFSSIEECAANLRIAPVEFARMANVILSVDRSIEILSELGFRDIPVRLRDWGALQQAIEESHAAGIRLNGEQITQFNRRMLETGS
jgi:hypothetical protein